MRDILHISKLILILHSLNATVLRLRLLGALKADSSASSVALSIAQNVVYDHPSIEKLAALVSKLVSGENHHAESPEARAKEAIVAMAAKPSCETIKMPSGQILLADDDAAIRTVLNQALSRAGYEVRSTSNAATLWRWISQGEGDLVITDVIMPEMDGPTLLKELRKTNPGLKFIFVSGYPDDAFKRSLDEKEAYSFLPKPFTLPQLAAKVKEQLAS